MSPANTRRRKIAAGVALCVGLSLAAAPAAFRMFSHAPKGAEMIDGFRPHMTEEQITGFQRDLETIGAAVVEARDRLPATSDFDPTEADPAVTALTRQWPEINADMSDMLTTMHEDLRDYRAVDALPSFTLFPWFFVIPGLTIAGFAAWGLRSGDRSRAPYVALVVAGAGLLLAPAVFQMFTRAPLGADMIDDFRPLMTTVKVQTIQGYFLVIGAGEGALRNEVVPALGADERPNFPALARFSTEWPRTSSEMAPMIGAMSDNVDNYRAVDALPPFSLFPWFFVIPGLIVMAAGAVAWRSPGEPTLSDSPSSSLEATP